MANITKREGKKGVSYLIRVLSGYQSDGKQIIKSTTYTPTHGMTAKQISKAVNEAAVLFEKRVKDGYVLDGNTRFSDFAKRWIDEYASKQLAPKTLERYKSLLVKINITIGNIRLDKLQPHHLQKFYNNLGEDGINEGSIFYVPQIDLGKLILEKRLKRIKMSQETNIATSTISSVCKGNKVRKETAETICKYLGIVLNESFQEIRLRSCLADTTILHYHRLIGTILQTAVQWQVIHDNPARRVKPPKVPKLEAKYLEDTDLPAILEALSKERIRWRTMVLLLLYSGVRRGELCGLDWKDIDFENKIIHIRRSIQYVVGLGVITKGTKNISSNRVIKLPEDMFFVLKEYKAWQNSIRLKIGDYWHDEIKVTYADGSKEITKNDRVFTQENGLTIFPDSITQWVNEFVKKNRFPKFTPHTLRHTNISLLIAAGVPIRNVSQRAGHSQLSTTSNIYAHAIKTVDEIAAEAIGNALKLEIKIL